MPENFPQKIEDQPLTKELVKKMVGETKGEVRGVVFKTDMEFVLREKGKEGLKKVEDKAKELGFPIGYETIKAMGFYPVGLRIMSLLIIKEAFGFTGKEIEKMGFFATKVSLIVKLFIKYFFSFERVFFKEAPRMWKKHYTIGSLVPIELDQEKKYAVLRVENFNLKPIYCLYLAGYFSGILQMLTKAEKINYQERKCSFKGDDFHEFIIKWS